MKWLAFVGVCGDECCGNGDFVVFEGFSMSIKYPEYEFIHEKNDVIFISFLLFVCPLKN